MDPITQAFQQDRTIDITTTGRKSGLPRRIEIWFHNLDGRLYIMGSPGKRGWYANLLAAPNFIFHLKQSAVADLPATATPILDEPTRRQVLARIIEMSQIDADLEEWVAGSPLVEVMISLKKREEK